MGVNGVSGVNSNQYGATSPSNVTNATETSGTTSTATEAAATYEGSVETKPYMSPQDRTAIIEQMKADAEARNAQLRSLVQKMMVDQGKTYGKANGKNGDATMFDLLRTGQLNVDDKTRLQAQKDIAEDGYWGVEQTSDRLVSFAKALAGNDSSKAEKLVDAIKKGFGLAEKAWGGELPDICKQTLDVTLEKMDAWMNEGK